jgi:putative transposase
MKQIRTVKIQLKVANSVFKPTLEAYTNAFNQVCKTAWDNQEFNGVRLHHLTYKRLREETKLKSQLVISARVKATEALASVIARKKKGNKVSCPQSKCCSIRYDDRSLTVDFKNNTVNILTVGGRVRLPIFVPKYFKQYLSWKRCSADLFQTKGKTFLHIVFEREVEDVKPSGDFVGVDRGIRKLAVTSDNRFFGGSRIKRLSEIYERLRGELQSKGTRSARTHLKKINRCERLMRKDINHCIAKKIVEGLKPGTTIVLEKLTGIRGGARKLNAEERKEGKKTLRKPQRKEVNKWNFFQLEQFLTYKSLARGCNVEYVDARYTSQRCSKCGHIARSNRKCQSLFKCKKCGFQLNADLNASRNIVLKHLDATCYPNKVNVNLPNGGCETANVHLRVRTSPLASAGE